MRSRFHDLVPAVIAAPAGIEPAFDACPIKVVVVDAERVPEYISADHPEGGRYRGVWALVRVAGIPRSLVKLGFASEALTREELTPYLRRVSDRVAGEQPAPPLERHPRVSVIVCSAFARLDELHECMRSISAIDYDNYEVIVVDNRPAGAALPDWFARFPDVSVVSQPRPGLSAARNRGLEAAGGEIVAFTDDDVVVDSQWLNALARRFGDHPDEAAISGLVVPKELETPAQLRYEEYYYRTRGEEILRAASYRLAVPRGHHFFRKATMEARDDDGSVVATFSLYAPGRLGGGANMAFRVGPLRELGGFNVCLGAGSPTGGGEDIVTLLRLAWRGHSVGFDPAAFVLHVHRREDAALQRQMRDNGAGFTAAVLSIIAEDKRHLGPLIATAPRALRELSRTFWRKLRTRAQPRETASEASSVSNLARIELRGMLGGPIAYGRSVVRARRWHG